MGGGKHRVVALAGILEHGIADVVDKVDVVAGPAGHGVGAGAAVQQIVAGVTVDRVAQAVAIALQIGTALQDQIFHVRRQPEMGGRENRVVAFAGILDHCVTDIVDEVDVAAGRAIHRIGTGVAVEQIVSGIAVEHVAQDVAVCLQIGALRSPTT